VQVFLKGGYKIQAAGRLRLEQPNCSTEHKVASSSMTATSTVRGTAVADPQFGPPPSHWCPPPPPACYEATSVQSINFCKGSISLVQCIQLKSITRAKQAASGINRCKFFGALCVAIAGVAFNLCQHAQERCIAFPYKTKPQAQTHEKIASGRTNERRERWAGGPPRTADFIEVSISPCFIFWV